MKNIIAALLLVFLLDACSTQEAITEGKIHYSIDYPNQKNNFFLYSILPKEMEVAIKGNKIHTKITKANMTNALLVDCNKKQVAAYFNYGDESFQATLFNPDIEQLLGGKKKYSIHLTNEKDTMAGFHVSKAIAICETNKKDQIDLWYTHEIAVKNANWYTPFKGLDGFLLAYTIERYGIRMNFKAVGFEAVAIRDSDMELPKGGIKIPYLTFNSKLEDLFKSFE